MSEKSSAVADRMRDICSRREYSVSDIRKKLLKALDGDVTEAEAILEGLVRDRYVDDLRYASAFARDKSSIAGWGRIKIRYMLSSKGISGDVVEKALEEVDLPKSDARLDRLLECKARSLAGDPQRRLKLLRFALGRGYTYDEVNDKINSMTYEGL